MSKRRRLNVHQGVRFNPEQIDVIRAAAAARGVTASEFIRGAALAQANCNAPTWSNSGGLVSIQYSTSAA